MAAVTTNNTSKLPPQTNQATAQYPKAPYTFASEPHSQRKKFRDPFDQPKNQPPVNIMYDKRVHRGNTYAVPILPLHAQPDPVELQRAKEFRRKLLARKKAEQQRRPQTPDAEPGRKHIDVQTELYLEELWEKVPEASVKTQTDAFLDRAPSPLYIPQKSGVDVATQIEEGDLFDFDYEVTPILEVLAGKTMEQALLEVIEEDELESLRKRQAEFEARRNAEIAETQRMEDAERRRTEEKERRLAEQIRLLREKQELANKVAARAFSSSYIVDLVPSVISSLSRHGYFYDAVEKEVESLFLPWLTKEVNSKLNKEMKVVRACIDDIIRNAVTAYRSQQQRY